MKCCKMFWFSKVIFTVLFSHVVKGSELSDLTLDVCGRERNVSKLVTADCDLQHLIICRSHQTIDASLHVVNNCQSLQDITFKGDGYHCDPSAWAPLLAITRNRSITLISQNTSCSYTILECYQESNPDFIHQMECQSEEVKLKRVPSCKIGHAHQISVVSCKKLNLTNEDLQQHFPSNTKTINYASNQITDVSNLIERMMDLPILTLVHFSNNRIETLPNLPDPQKRTSKVTFNFSNNNITRLDLKGLKSFLAYGGVRLWLKNNQLKCDCALAEILVELKQDLPKLIGDLFEVFCEDTNGELIRPWYVDYSHCETRPSFTVDIYDILIILVTAWIGLMIYLNIDLEVAIRKMDSGVEEVSTPKIHTWIELLRTYSNSAAKMVSSSFRRENSNDETSERFLQ